MVQSKVHTVGAVEFHEHLADLRREDGASGSGKSASMTVKSQLSRRREGTSEPMKPVADDGNSRLRRQGRFAGGVASSRVRSTCAPSKPGIVRGAVVAPVATKSPSNRGLARSRSRAPFEM